MTPLARRLRLLPSVARWLVLAAALGACVHAPLEAPEKGGSPWTEVTSAHFVLKTDLDARTAADVSAKLEQIFAALAEFGFHSDQPPTFRIDVVYLRGKDEYVMFAPKLSGGAFFPSGLHDFERGPIAILGGDFVQATRETMQHELTHLFIHAYYPQAPTWLNEGLAQYMETMAIEDDRVVVGRQPSKHRFWKGPPSHRSDPSGVTMLLPMSEAPAPEELRRMSPAQFYGNRDLDPMTNEGRMAAETMSVHYAAAWTLVHMLLTDETYASAFSKCLERIHEGASEAVAWQETVGTLSAHRLEEDYQQALVPKEVTVLRAKWSVPPYGAVKDRAMTSSEVHVLWARLRPETPEGRSAAQADLSEARKLGEADQELALVQAYWLAEAGQIPAAQEDLRATITAHPQDPRLWSALGWLTARTAKPENGTLAPSAQKALADVAEHLAPIAESASQLDLLANVSALQRNADAALAYEKRAVAADPNCVPCLAEAARIMYAKGLVRDALDTATFALGLLPEGQRLPALDELVERCRTRLANPAESEGGRAKIPPRGPAAKR